MEVTLADYPCDWHLARYKGPSHRLYLNLFREEDEIRLKASVCGDCLADIMTEWLSRALHQAEGGTWDPPEDDQDLEGLWMASGGRSGPVRRNGRH